MNLEHLPNELLLKILNGVAWSNRPASTRAAIAIGGVCQRWRGLRHAIDLNCTWADMRYFSHPWELELIRLKKVWSMVKAYRLVSLDLTQICYGQSGPVTVMTPMLQEPTVWRSIVQLDVCVEGITLPALNILAEKTPMVQTLSLSLSSNPGTYVDALRHWRCLRAVHLKEHHTLCVHFIRDLVTVGPRSLRWIDIKYNVFPEADLIALLQAFPLLVRFEMTPTERYTECVVAIIERWAPNLQVLYINPRSLQFSSFPRLVSWNRVRVIQRRVHARLRSTTKAWEAAKATFPDTDRAALRQSFIHEAV
jgi:hypothetical protein